MCRIEWVEKNGREFRPSIAPLGIYTYLREIGTKNKLRLHSLLSWISSSISNQGSHQIHLTDAASLGMVDLNKNDWLDFGGPFKNLIYPEIMDHNDWNLSGTVQNLVLSTAVGDQQASLYGAGLDKESVVVNIGTGGQIAYLGALEDSWTFQKRPFFNGLVLNTKTHLPAGRALAAYTKVLASGDNTASDYEWMDKCALEVIPFSNLDLSKFEGIENEDSPTQWDAQFASTVVHSLINVYANILNENRPLIGDRKLIFAGGVGQKLSAISKYLALKTNLKFQISNSIETTIEGLQKLAQEQD